MFTAIKDWLIRKVAQTYAIRILDGRKKEIMRIVQGLLMVLGGVSALLPDSELGQLVATNLDQASTWILVILGHLGLEFAIEDEEIKRKQGIE